MSRDALAGLTRLQPHLNGLTIKLFYQVLVPEQFVKVFHLDVTIDRFIDLVDLHLLACFLIGVSSLKNALKQVAFVLELLNVDIWLLALVEVIELDVTSTHLFGELVLLQMSALLEGQSQLTDLQEGLLGEEDRLVRLLLLRLFIEHGPRVDGEVEFARPPRHYYWSRRDQELSSCGHFLRVLRAILRISQIVNHLHHTLFGLICHRCCR